MHDTEFSKIVRNQMDICTNMLITKAAEYATDSDRLHNFRVASAISGDPMKKVP